MDSTAFLLVIIGIIIIWLVTRDVVPSKLEPCDGPHSWAYDINNQMYCKLCKVRPGVDND